MHFKNKCDHSQPLSGGTGVVCTSARGVWKRQHVSEPGP